MFLSLSMGMQIVIVVVAIITTLVLLYFAAISVIKGFKSIIDENYIDFEDVVPYPIFTKRIKSRIKASNIETVFSILALNVDNIRAIETSVNQKISRKILEALIGRVNAHFGHDAVIGAKAKGEFLIYLDQTYNQIDVMPMVYELMSVLREPYLINTKSEFTVNVSIAVAFYPIHGVSFNVLMRNLTHTVKTIQNEGGNAIRNCQSANVVFNEEYVDYYRQVKIGIKEKQFEFYYLPIIETKTNKVEGFSSFVRWNHPTLGVLPASKFIHVINQSGDLYWLSLHALETACTEIKKLSIMFNANIFISILIGLHELSKKNIVRDFKKIIRSHRIDPKHIILEVPESVILGNKENENYQTLSKLRNLGFSVVTDIYGVSPQELKRISERKIEYFKIGNPFVLDTETELTKMYLHLMKDLAVANNIRIIASKVEDLEHYKLYEEAKITLMQGYYFTQPQPIYNLEAWKEEFYKSKEKVEEPIKEDVKDKETLVLKEVIVEEVSNLQEEPKEKISKTKK
ncbi:MAG: EAL domain-containing protein [Acholeplasmatales bacterium]